MNNLTKALMEELTVEYVKVGPLQIPESVVISWVILAIVTIGSILLTRNLKVDHISKRQAVLEMAYLAGTNFFEGLLGEKGQALCALPDDRGHLHRLQQPDRRVRCQAPRRRIWT